MREITFTTPAEQLTNLRTMLLSSERKLAAVEQQRNSLLSATKGLVNLIDRDGQGTGPDIERALLAITEAEATL